MRPVQYFTEEYLEQCRKMPAEERLRFLEEFRNLQDRRRAAPKKPKTRLISLRIEETVLERLKESARRAGKPYQTHLKDILRGAL